ncbi:MAG: hypothetical protein AAF598_18870 [Bacteroidota bacterium]
MNEQILDQNTERQHLTLGIVLTQIWVKPKTIFQQIEHNKFGQGLFLLAGLLGFYGAVIFGHSVEGDLNIQPLSHFLWVLARCFLIGFPLGIGILFLFSAIIGSACQNWGGIGGTRNSLRALVYGGIPLLVSFLLLMVQILVEQHGLLLESFDGEQSAGVLFVFLYILKLCFKILIIWAALLIITGLSVIHNIHFAYSILSLFISSIVTIWIIVVVFMVFVGYLDG